MEKRLLISNKRKKRKAKTNVYEKIKKKWKMRKMVKKDDIHKVIFIIIFLLIFILIALLLLKRKIINIFSIFNRTYKPYNWKDEKLIVHSLGKYNNVIYSNSLEALNYWYHEKNMRLMEADFLLTRDNHTVLAHDFGYLGSNPTLEKFTKSHARGRLTHMTFEDLVKFMDKNKDLFIITDTKYPFLPHIKIEFDEMDEILSRYHNVKERFIIEIYHEKMFLYLKENYNYKYFMFTLYKRWNSKNYEDLENIFDFCAKNKIDGIIMYKHLFNSRINDLSKKYSIPVYLHTENNLIKIANFLKDVKGIFTDEISKSILNEYISNQSKLL